jgi:ribonuclease T2
VGRYFPSWRAYGGAIALTLATVLVSVALAQDRRQAEAGQFDFYVLALSWSPSYCESARTRAPNRSPDQQCRGRPFAFVVHGLWPQYERGFPSYCQVPAPRLNHAIVERMLDLMPSPGLIYHEWDRHGTCAGLSPQAYFDNVRRARFAVKIPPDYLALDTPASVTPDEVVDAFTKANPALSRQAISVACDGKRLTEVWLCLAKDFSFRACPEISRRACRRDRIAMPALRGGR